MSKIGPGPSTRRISASRPGAFGIFRLPMPKIFPGRFTANFDQPFVVFLIGMRINQLWAFHKWMPVASAMPPMLSYADEESRQGTARCAHLDALARSFGGAILALVRRFGELRASGPLNRTCRCGRTSISASAPTVASASGTKPIWSTLASTSASTGTCHSSDWRLLPVMSLQSAIARPRDCVSAGTASPPYPVRPSRRKPETRPL